MYMENGLRSVGLFLEALQIHHGTTFSEIGDRELLLTLHYWNGVYDYYPGAPIPRGEEYQHRLITISFLEPEDIKFSGYEYSNQQVEKITWTEETFNLEGSFSLSFLGGYAKIVAVEKI